MTKGPGDRPRATRLSMVRLTARPAIEAAAEVLYDALGEPDGVSWAGADAVDRQAMMALAALMIEAALPELLPQVVDQLADIFGVDATVLHQGIAVCGDPRLN